MTLEDMDAVIRRLTRDLQTNDQGTDTMRRVLGEPHISQDIRALLFDHARLLAALETAGEHLKYSNLAMLRAEDEVERLRSAITQQAPSREAIRALIERQQAALADGSITPGVLATLILNLQDDDRLFP